ncbi:hypothetical protein C8Q76DRAFT_315401 [Earliella scabrosa]|nr:hypothetical protein C8Q76DRAFT_315401 [Earliella scabrosa]
MVMNLLSNLCTPPSAPQQLTVALYGDPACGKKTLCSTLNARKYTRFQDQKRFSFDVQLKEPTTSIALILADASSLPETIDPALRAARQCAPVVCLVYTKVDLVPRDYSINHIEFLGSGPFVGYTYDLDFFSVSCVTGEGIDDLLEYIVNAVDPLPGPTPKTYHELLANLRDRALDWIAWWFALPTRRMTVDISSELPATVTDSDVSGLFGSEIDAAWADSLKRRLDAEDVRNIPIYRLTPSIIAKVASTSERAAMEFVLKNTTVPIPRVHCPHLDLLTMDYIDGDMLYECWHKQTWFMQFRIACTLRLYVKQLRSLRRSNVGTVDDYHVGGAFFDFNRYPPFASLRRFRQFCEYVACVGWQTRVQYELHQGLTPSPFPRPNFDWSPVLTHGDLNASNILLDRSGSLWIVDWGAAGFYPACIESLAMHHVECVVHSREATDTWVSYRTFIAGATTRDEEDFWHNLYSAIHRFPSM